MWSCGEPIISENRSQNCFYPSLNFLFAYSFCLSHYILHILSPNLTHLPSTQNKIWEQNKGGGNKGWISSWKLQCDAEGHTVNSFIHRYFYMQEFIVNNHFFLVWGPWSLLHHWCWALTGTLSGHNIAALCCGDLEALG